MNSLKDVLDEKAKANALLMEKKYSKAELAYKKIIEDIDKLLQNENIENKNEILEQKKLIMSNLFNYNKGIIFLIFLIFHILSIFNIY